MKHSAQKHVFVTRPSLPPLEEFVGYLERIWSTRILTNNGPIHQEFELELANYLGVKHVSLFSNGTLALITALQALNISGEVITTPFSFVATTHSLWWNGITPVFVDIEPKYCNLDPAKIEAAITSRTTAILPVHVYGNPCEVYEISRIAEKHNLKVIYDAAHAFGVNLDGTSVLNFGDLSVLSFHATKTFNTFEGGAIISHDLKTKERIDLLKNFGIVDELTVLEPGINGKMNEVQASLGLLQLKYVDEYINKRKFLANYYVESLLNVSGLKVIASKLHGRQSYNYVPLVVNENIYGERRDSVYARLQRAGIFARRYFYPLISQMPIYKDLPSAAPDNLVIAEQMANQILCLPIYPELSLEEVDFVCSNLKK